MMWSYVDIIKYGRDKRPILQNVSECWTGYFLYHFGGKSWIYVQVRKYVYWRFLWSLVFAHVGLNVRNIKWRNLEFSKCGTQTLYFILLSSYFFPVCVYRISFICNFGRRPACTSVLTWDMTLVYYRLLQFHPDVLTDSVLSVLLFSFDWDWKWNWKSLWYFGCFLGSFWNHHLQPKLFSQEYTN